MSLPNPPRRPASLSTPALLLLLLTAGCLLWGLSEARRASASGAAAAPYFAGFLVTHTGDSGQGSLRQAILDANANPGPDNISFNIPGAGVHTITPASPLPVINGPVNIDGYTQPGAVANSLGVGSNAVLLIELNGTAAGAAANGLEVTANNVTVSGLVINRFGGHGILFNEGAERTVTGCYIGTNAAGTADLGNGGHGVVIVDGNSSTVGGTTAGERNLIAGNGGDGVRIAESDPVVGSDLNAVQGNLIGVGTGGGALPNGGDGVYVFGDNNAVGGESDGEGNVIANSGGDGVEIEGGVMNTVRGNSIFSNAGLGINLRPGGEPDGTVTPNDPFDQDAGPNNLQNFPVIDSATSTLNGTVVTGTLDSLPAGGFRIHFYSSPSCDASGNGEGQTYIGSANVATDDGGHTTFNASLVPVTTVGHFVTATATTEDQNTSEFSPCRVVEAQVFRWNGSDDTDWHNGANWNTNSVPTASDIAVIPSAGVTNEPTVSAADADVASLTVEAGRTLTVTANRTLSAATTNVNAGATLHVPAGQPATLAGALRLDGALTGGDAASDFRYTGATLTNNGTVSVGVLRFAGASQTLTGTGAVTSGLTQVLAGASLSLGANHTLGALTVETGGTFSQGASFDLTLNGQLTVNAGGTFRNIGTGDLTLGGDVTNEGAVNLDGGGAACGDADSILLRSTDAAAQRAWTGAGTFSLADVDVSGQAGTAPVSVRSGTNSGNNGANWTFTVCPAGTTLTVNTNDDGDDGACNAAHCSLREAILTSNSTPGQVEFIAFQIGGGGLQTISPAAALPTVTAPVTIDGTTQPGFTDRPLVELNGAGAGAVTAALDITAGGSTVRGLVINRFGGHAVRLASAGGNTVAGNFIGTNASGTAAQANEGVGVFIDSSPNNNVGGLTAAERNLISGNLFSGVHLSGQGATGNRVLGNLIGTDLGGAVALGNGNFGVFVEGAPGNIVGGASAAARNLISGNVSGVAVVFAGASSNLVQGNFIGTQADGVSALPNLMDGVVFDLGASGNRVGGANAGEGNRIAFNGGDGVLVLAGTGNRVLSNSIHSNGTTAQHLGIDLGPDGVTPDDAGDGDAGANNLQNFPVINNAVSNGAATGVTGTLNSTASTAFRVEFFSNAACDPGGHGEGAQLLGSADVATDGNGGALFNVSLPNVAVGQLITATATDPSGNTSEFSACRAVIAATYTLSGRVTDENAQPLQGVTVQLSGSADLDTATDAAGNYTFTNLPQGGNFTVTPSLTNYGFTPPSRTVSNVQSDQAGLDFTGKFLISTLSGRVTNAGGEPLVGVNVRLSGSAVRDTTTDAAGNYTFAGLSHGGSFTVTPSETSYRFTPPSRTVGNLQGDQTGLDFTGALITHNITGRIVDAGGAGLPGVGVTLAGARSGVAFTGPDGSFTFGGVPAGGSFVLTPEGEGFSFDPPSFVVTDISADVSFNPVGTAQVAPTPTPDPGDDFEGGPEPDPEKWAEGTNTNPSVSFDPLVGVFVRDGLLHIQPRADANGASFGGIVSVRAVDLDANPLVGVEVVQTAQGDGAQTVFGLGADADHYVRFVVQNASEPVPPPAANVKGVKRGADNLSADQTLLFQLNLGGDKFTASVTYDPVQHRFWRFRHDPALRLVIFETSPDFAVWTERFRARLPADQAALVAELSAGTTRATPNPGEALFDNFLVAPSPRAQFEVSSFAVRESDGSAVVSVVRTGGTESPLTVSYATGGGTATAGSDYANVSGTLLFGAGERLKSFTVPVFNDDLTEGAETFNVTLSNPSGGRLGAPAQASVNILDDESENPINDAEFFVRQHYLDFLGREPDAEGLRFWTDDIRSCGSDSQCREVKRVNVSAAFFLSIEFQGTGFFVQRLYRLSFGRAPLFAEYVPDQAAVREGVVVGRPGALERLELNKSLFAEQFVNRAPFKAKFDAVNDAQYVDALAAAAGVTLPEAERTALVVGLLTRRETRANVLLGMAERDAFARSEFRRAFVQMQYFGYLRRDPDAEGFDFWLTKLNDFGGDHIRAEMVKAFISSIEYRQRFGRP